MAPYSRRNTCVAHPIYESDGVCTKWFKFADEYLSPEVLYGSWPPLTTIKLGGRILQVDRAVSVKLTLLEPREDYRFWLTRRQHSERVNLGQYHRDFSDVEVAYSFSSPQTHIWFTGYSIHFEAFENLSIASYNATVHIRPEHLLPGGGTVTTPLSERGTMQHSTKLSNCRKTSQSAAPCARPMYTVQVPSSNGGAVPEYTYIAQHLNDCEREIKIRDQYSVGVGIASLSSPVSLPPNLPPPDTFAVPGYVHSNAGSKSSKEKSCPRCPIHKHTDRTVTCPYGYAAAAAVPRLCQGTPSPNGSPSSTACPHLRTTSPYITSPSTPSHIGTPSYAVGTILP